MKSSTIDFSLLDKAIDEIMWGFANLFPGCLIKSIDGIRMKKKFFWDQTKLANRHWLAANMNSEALLGFRAFNEKKAITTMMRTKEQAEDYRFISDPDLPILKFEQSRIIKIKSALPETRQKKLQKLI